MLMMMLTLKMTLNDEWCSSCRMQKNDTKHKSNQNFNFRIFWRCDHAMTSDDDKKYWWIIVRTLSVIIITFAILKAINHLLQKNSDTDTTAVVVIICRNRHHHHHRPHYKGWNWQETETQWHSVTSGTSTPPQRLQHQIYHVKCLIMNSLDLVSTTRSTFSREIPHAETPKRKRTKAIH